MPTIPLHPTATVVDTTNTTVPVLPKILQTPSGLALVELQGTLNIPPYPPDSTSSTEIGTFVFDTDDSNFCWMYVGRNQRMRGQVKKLSTPLGVIRRRLASPSTSSTASAREEMLIDSTTDSTDSISNTTELEIVDIIYYKLIFSSRPEPMSGGSAANM
jgi:chromosome transmission fidelity protein 8